MSEASMDHHPLGRGLWLACICSKDSAPATEVFWNPSAIGMASDLKRRQRFDRVVVFSTVDCPCIDQPAGQVLGAQGGCELSLQRVPPG